MRVITTILLLFVSILSLVNSTTALLPFQIDDIGAAATNLAGSIVDRVASNDRLERFWEDARTRGPQIADEVFKEVTKLSSDAASAVTELKGAAEQMIEHVQKIQAAVEERGIKMVQVSSMLAREIDGALQDLMEDISDPLPEDRGERPKARERLLQIIKDKLRPVYVRVLAKLGIPREESKAQFDAFWGLFIRVLLLIGWIADEYPFLLEALQFAISILLGPKFWIFKSILTALGFGFKGPIKGSTAAWFQRHFYGGAVPANSLFSRLQKMAMTPGVPPEIWQPIRRGIAHVLGRAAGDL